MAGLISDPILGNDRLDARGLDAMNSSTGDVLGAMAEDTAVRNPLASLMRAHSRALVELGVTDELGGQALPPSPMIDGEDATNRFGIEGHLKFDRPVPETTAAELRDLKLAEIRRNDLLARGEGGIGETIGKFAVGLGVSAVDPLNLASAFVPVVGPTRYALWLERAGASAASRAGVRAGVGAAEGAVGAALVEPLVYGVAKQEQADYGAVDSLLNIAFGGVLGGGLHAGGGAVADRIAGRAVRAAPTLGERVDAAPFEARETALRASVAELAEHGTIRSADAILAPEIERLHLRDPSGAASGDRASPDPASAEFDRLFSDGSRTALAAPEDWKVGDAIRPGERPMLEGLVAEVDHTSPAQLVQLGLSEHDFRRQYGYHTSGERIRVASERPAWFQALQRDESIGPEDLRRTIGKMLEDKPLGAREQRIAEAAMSRVREIRTDNVRAMIEFRQGREAQRLAAFDDFARREAGDVQQLAPANETPAAERAAAELELANQDLARLEAIGVATKDAPELTAAAELEREATALGKAYDAAAFCMSRRGS